LPETQHFFCLEWCLFTIYAAGWKAFPRRKSTPR